MKTKNKVTMLTFLCAALMLTTIGTRTANATTSRTPGVHVGDWGEYFLSVTGNATMGEGGGPQPGANYTKFTVTDVSGTNITVNAIVGYDNGTQITETDFIDVDSGQGNASALFIAANLTAGDLLYTGNWSGGGPISSDATINETIMRNYLGSTVEVNHLNVTTGGTYPWGNYSFSVSYYWFRATGMVVEMRLDYWFQNTTTYESASFYGQIISVIPEFSPVLVVPIVLVVTLVAVLFSKFLLKPARVKKYSLIN